MKLLKSFFNDNSTVVGLCDLTQKTTDKIYNITAKPKTQIKPQLNPTEIKQQTQKLYSSNPYISNNFTNTKAQTDNNSHQAMPNKKIVNALAQKQQHTQQNFFMMK